MGATINDCAPEMRERVVLGNEAQHGCRWAALLSITNWIGCTPQTLNGCDGRRETDSGARGHAAEMAKKMRALERENREPCQGHGFSRNASGSITPPEPIG
ncbi:hypothetical protein O4G76_09460 [Limimaricola sp. G21655-S1]|uniref:hypothetical protein n=1 Tax=Limimaricola sp. G21655-S1 TaxID=3014768 RepID=UPI0022AEB920|nr:hypothetical protein [Limimaricola sp. G21655-S1]MCZ4261064.1 hypothetical protein [Limimaricola sp. G21655-S1]